MLPLIRTRARATLRRSVQLLASFPQEQRNPRCFYENLAEDTAQLAEALAADAGLRGNTGSPEAQAASKSHRLPKAPTALDQQPSPLHNAVVLDVGGGPGFFVDAFRRRGARYLSCDVAGDGVSVHASGTALPFRSRSIDVTYSSNVVEHVVSPWTMCEEMLRVTRPGGLAIISYTIWLGPFGGHETGLWQHYVGGTFARDRYTARHGHPPKNAFGYSLFDVSCSEGLAWARSVQMRGDAELVAAFPRYHPRWAWWMVNVPWLREYAVSNLVLVMRKNR